MAVWMVRAGRNGEQEERALKSNVAASGWVDLPDLSDVNTREELRALYESTRPDADRNRAANHVGQIWGFIKGLKANDLIVLPLKLQSAVAVGEVTGGYQFRNDLGPDMVHVRPAKWIRTDIPRTNFGQDLLYSFGALMTVCRIQRNNAEERVRATLAGNLDPGSGVEEVETVDETADIEQAARDQVVQYISARFKGHELARLVEAVLQAQGYVTRRSDPGPDGGVDILAGAGPMGFDSPRICVQVKSSFSPTDVNVLRSLQGTLPNFRAQQGLLVSWGGFTKSTLEEARRSFFDIRLWDADNLLQAVLDNYKSLPESLRAELPLKRVWALVPEEE